MKEMEKEREQLLSKNKMLIGERARICQTLDTKVIILRTKFVYVNRPVCLYRGQCLFAIPQVQYVTHLIFSLLSFLIPYYSYFFFSFFIHYSLFSSSFMRYHIKVPNYSFVFSSVSFVFQMLFF